eukprot:m.383405 g.383405  ORF g.383405 m.383405 type:complete len:346 (+) comp20046_c1_seq6:1243-2280(+)
MSIARVCLLLPAWGGCPSTKQPWQTCSTTTVTAPCTLGNGTWELGAMASTCRHIVGLMGTWAFPTHTSTVPCPSAFGPTYRATSQSTRGHLISSLARSTRTRPSCNSPLTCSHSPHATRKLQSLTSTSRPAQVGHFFCTLRFNMCTGFSLLASSTPGHLSAANSGTRLQSWTERSGPCLKHCQTQELTLRPWSSSPRTMALRCSTGQPAALRVAFVAEKARPLRAGCASLLWRAGLAALPRAPGPWPWHQRWTFYLHWSASLEQHCRLRWLLMAWTCHPSCLLLAAARTTSQVQDNHFSSTHRPHAQTLGYLQLAGSNSRHTSTQRAQIKWETSFVMLLVMKRHP